MIETSSRRTDNDYDDYDNDGDGDDGVDVGVGGGDDVMMVSVAVVVVVVSVAVAAMAIVTAVAVVETPDDVTLVRNCYGDRYDADDDNGKYEATKIKTITMTIAMTSRKKRKMTMMKAKFLMQRGFLIVIFCAQVPWTRLSRADRD